MNENTRSAPFTPYQVRLQQIAAALEIWAAGRAYATNPIRRAQSLLDCLETEGLQILPRAATRTDWRVAVDNEPAPAPAAPDRPSGPLDADAAAEAFLTAAAHADSTGTTPRIVVRPATDRELAGRLVGDHALHPDPVTVQVSSWALLQTDGQTVLAATDDSGTSVELVFDGDEFGDLTVAANEDPEDDQ